jgi:hypothetical protein
MRKGLGLIVGVAAHAAGEAREGGFQVIDLAGEHGLDDLDRHWPLARLVARLERQPSDTSWVLKQSQRHLGHIALEHSTLENVRTTIQTRRGGA